MLVWFQYRGGGRHRTGDRGDRVAGVADVFQLGRQVAALELFIGEVVPGLPVEGVAALLGDEVQSQTAGLDGGVGTTGGDLHLFEHVEVPVGRRSTESSGVGNVDPVEDPHCVVPLVAAGDDAGLLTRLVTSHVETVQVDAGHLIHDYPGIARRWDVGQVLLRHLN